METILPLVCSFLVAFIALFVSKRKRKDSKEKKPPKNTSADISRETLQQTFEEEVSRVKMATESKDPAGDLADLGNARRR